MSSEEVAEKSTFLGHGYILRIACPKASVFNAIFPRLFCILILHLRHSDTGKEDVYMEIQVFQAIKKICLYDLLDMMGNCTYELSTTVTAAQNLHKHTIHHSSMRA